MIPVVSNSQLTLYGLPALVVGYTFMFVNVYLLKYATDVLLIAPAVMGTIFGLARIWDAFTDPVVGYLSDRTTSRLGRRRIWLAFSVFPVAGFYAMLFGTPASFTPASAAIWMTIAVFGFYTAMTAISVPHLSLAAETTKDSHDRNRLFGMRHAMVGVGSVVALITVAWFNQLPNNDELRQYSLWAAAVVGAISIALVLATALGFRERADNDEPRIPTAGVYTASRQILGNRHARLLLIVQFIEAIGGGALGAAALYVAQYVMGQIEIAPVSIIAYMATAMLTIPMWVKIAARIGKVRLWIMAMVGSALSYGGLFTLVFFDNPQTQVAVLLVLSITSGATSGCAHTLAPSVLSDVIDDDDLRTGSRKEGAYFALYNLANKSAQGVTVMIAGFVLSLVGFVPNQDQPFNVQLAMCALLGLFPLVCYAIGAVMFTRFDLREAKHAGIVAALAKRDGVQAPASS